MLFTEAEQIYLGSQTLGRLATVAPDGFPQNNPVSFRYNPETGTIDIGGRALGQSRKYRNVLTNPRVSLIVDDIVSMRPWQVRAIEIRGSAEALKDQPPPMPYFSGEVIRIHPARIITWGIEPGEAELQARTVSSDPGDEAG